MRLRVFSDLHLEFSGFKPPPVEADLVILAGDIDVGASGLQWAREAFTTPVLYVAGNHEYYGQHWDGLRLELAAVSDARVQFLERGCVVSGGVRFLGATLWTDFALFGEGHRDLAMLAAGQRMNDYRMIHAGGPSGRLTPALSRQWHEDTLRWLDETLAQPFGGPTVVISHHLPHPASVEERFRRNLVSAAYASNLSALITRHAPALWIHGHSHNSFDYQVGATRVLSNPRGYPVGTGFENARFDATRVVTL